MTDKQSVKAVEAALLKNAIGYEYQETVEEIIIDNGRPKTINKRTVTKHKPPDTQAMRFWLINMFPDKWKDKPPIEGNAQALEKVDIMLAEVMRIAQEESNRQPENLLTGQ